MPATASAQLGDGPWLCGVQGLAEKAGVDTDTYVNRPGITKPEWLNGESLVVENFPGAPDTAPGTLAFVLERTTFAPPGTITRTDPGKDAVGTYVSSQPAENIVPGKTLVVPNVGPLCPQTVTPGTPGPTFTASKMGLQQAFLAGSFRPLRVVPAGPSTPAGGGQQPKAREHSVPSTVRVIERRNSSGSTVAYVDVGASLTPSDAQLDFGWRRSRGYWGQAGFTTTYRSTVTAAVTQAADISNSTSVSGIVGGGAFGPIPFTVRLGATVAGRLKAPGTSRLTSTRTKKIPLIVRCQTRRTSSGSYCTKVSGAGRDPSGVSWSISYRTGGDVILRGSITPTVSMLIADLVGPYAGVTGGAGYEVDVSSSGRYVSGGGEAFVTARAGGELRFLGWVKRFGFDIWSRTWPY